ncbi:MAG: ADP-ribosylglycohydrolase family protein [Actinomycetales bacterium]
MGGTSGARGVQLVRATGALLGLAIGDALGMPTQLLPRELVKERWGTVAGFEPGPVDNEISPGTPEARVTDDTDQALILARLLVAGRGRVEPRDFADALLGWERGMVAQGSADLLGPSTRRALTLLADGASVADSGRWGDTNGAAMRAAPIGILMPPAPLVDLVDLVAAVDRPTHDTCVANAGAGAVAAAVSAGLDGAGVLDAITVGVAAAELGARRGRYLPGADVASRIVWACALVADQAPTSLPASHTRSRSQDTHDLDLISRLVGTGVATQESVPAAFAVLTLYPHDPWAATRMAASLGGDSDTIAAMVGAVSGACHGAHAFPAFARQQVVGANPQLADLDSVAEALLDLRGTVAILRG